MWLMLPSQNLILGSTLLRYNMSAIVLLNEISMGSLVLSDLRRRCLNYTWRNISSLTYSSIKRNITSLGMGILPWNILPIIIFPDHLLSPFEVRACTSLNNTIYDLFIYHIKLLLVWDTPSIFFLGDSFNPRRYNILLILLKLFQFFSFRN